MTTEEIALRGSESEWWLKLRDTWHELHDYATERPHGREGGDMPERNAKPHQGFYDALTRRSFDERSAELPVEQAGTTWAGADQETLLDTAPKKKDQDIGEIVESLMRFQSKLAQGQEKMQDHLDALARRLVAVEQAPAADVPLPQGPYPSPVANGQLQPPKTGPSLIAGRIGILEDRLDQLTSQMIDLSQMAHRRLDRIEREVLGD